MKTPKVYVIICREAGKLMPFFHKQSVILKELMMT